MTTLSERSQEMGGATFTERLVAPQLTSAAGDAARGGFGLLLAATYGLALGARTGGSALGLHALGVPAGLAAVAFVAVPSLFVMLALVDAPLSPTGALTAATRALGVSGLLLAGLAPATALFVVTIDSAAAAGLIGFAGLALSGGIGLGHLIGGLSGQLESAKPGARQANSVAIAVFSIVAVGLCLRVWWGLLPMLGGGS